MSRRQLPPQIRKVEVTDRKTRKPVVRYQLTVDAGINPETGSRQQIRRRCLESCKWLRIKRIVEVVIPGQVLLVGKAVIDLQCELVSVRILIGNGAEGIEDAVAVNCVCLRHILLHDRRCSRVKAVGRNLTAKYIGIINAS